MATSSFASLIFVLFFTTLLIPAFTKSSRRLVAKLIHRDSVHSPYYNPNATSYTRAKQALKSSMARFTHLEAKTKTTTTNDYRAPVMVGDGIPTFLANISVGEPPVVQLVVMDTGSNLLWVQCLPCGNCSRQACPIFDPSKSSTYANVSCYSHYCTSLMPESKCDQSGHCEYNQEYEGGSTSIGTLATEKLTLETSDEGLSTLSNVVFGCGHQNHGNKGINSGVLGLGSHAISLAYHLGSKFSYCIGNINDFHYTYNNLILGDGAKMDGNSSPLKMFHGLYFVALEGISVGGKWLDIDPNIFKINSSNGHGGVVIDSGSTYSFFARGAFETLSNEVQNLLKGVLQRIPDPKSPTHLCYRGNISRDLKWFPVVTFKFNGGAELVLDIRSIFLEYTHELFCMAIDESPFTEEFSLVGAMAQQFYNVAYDVARKTIYFLRIDCQLLED